jgi:hypothetical protein
VVLDPGERGGEAAPCQGLENAVQRRVFCLAGQAIETLLGQQVEMATRNDSPSVDIKSPGKQHFLRYRVGPLQHAGHADEVTVDRCGFSCVGSRLPASRPLDGSDTRVRLSIGTWHLTEGSS